MVVVNLKGGLGNQMFQYAFGLYLASLNNTSLSLDLTFLLDRTPRQNFVFRNFDLDIFENKYEILDSEKVKVFMNNGGRIKRLLKKETTILNERIFSFDSSNILKTKNIYIDGYWQSEKYFKPIESLLRKKFTFKHKLTEKEQHLASEINLTNSICINFRRGDFVELKGSSETHGVTSMEYYENALAKMQKKVSDLKVFVFSDDIEWCKENISWEVPLFFVDHTYKGEKFSSYLHLMTLCKHFIIPNSTFGWWAAWLSNYENKIVIAPKKWFEDKTLQSQANDIYPEKWIKI